LIDIKSACNDRGEHGFPGQSGKGPTCPGHSTSSGASTARSRPCWKVSGAWRGTGGAFPESIPRYSARWSTTSRITPLRRRGAGAEALIAGLEREHADGGRALDGLKQSYARLEAAGDAGLPAFARAVEDFARAYFDHMRKEEEEQLFPLAEKLFTREDWSAIDRAFEENRDPLAAARDTRDFEKLFDRIVNLAPPPIGVGPDA
jgi:hypothetical protein